MTILKTQRYCLKNKNDRALIIKAIEQEYYPVKLVLTRQSS